MRKWDKGGKTGFKLSTCGGLGVASLKLGSDVIHTFRLQNLWRQKTARGSWQLELFPSFCFLHVLPRLTFLSGGIKFCHHRIKLSRCDTIFESHIHNLWIYYVEEKWEGSILHLFSPLFYLFLSTYAAGNEKNPFHILLLKIPSQLSSIAICQTQHSTLHLTRERMSSRFLLQNTHSLE